MVQAQGIDVYLAPFSDSTKRYKEYLIPVTSPSFTSDTNEVYIEAVDGERFVVVVDVGVGFDAKGSDGLVIRYQVDESATITPLGYQADEVATASGLKVARTVHDQTHRFIHHYRMQSGYTFSPLQMVDNYDVDHDQFGHVSRCGITVVKIRRFMHSRPAKYDFHQRPDEWVAGVNTMPDHQVSSKAVVIDDHVSHAVKHVTLGTPVSRITSPEQPHAGYHRYHVEGEDGGAITFKIRYRSLDALKALKIIPEDEAHIDLTDNAAPRSSNDRGRKRKALEDEVKDIELEQRKRRAQRELAQLDDADEDEVKVAPRRIKVEEPEVNADSQVQSGSNDRGKKRKALEAEFEQIEEEERLVDLRQRKRRVREELALLEE